MTFTAAVVQMASNPNDPLATASAAADRLRAAAANGAGVFGGTAVLHLGVVIATIGAAHELVAPL